MIPNSAPMAAVYLDAKKNLSSRPVAAWKSDTTEALVPDAASELSPATHTTPSFKLLGLWCGSWSPSYDEMVTLLPEHTPGTPHPLAVHVTVWQTPFGWAARHTADKSKLVAEALLYDDLERKLSILGNYHVDNIVQADED